MLINIDINHSIIIYEYSHFQLSIYVVEEEEDTKSKKGGKKKKKEETTEEEPQEELQEPEGKFPNIWHQT